MVRDAAALMLSTVVSAALGFAFWVVAARLLPADVVGQASALIAALTLLAGIAQLNLVNLYARFLPTAGAATRRLVAGGATTSVAMSGLLCLAYFGLGLDRGLLDGVAGRVLFALAVAASAWHMIADGVLTPLGRAAWVPAKNVLTATAKLLLLVAGASAGLGADGITLAWIVPVAVSVALVAIAITKLVRPDAGTAPEPASSGLRSAGSEATGATREDGAAKAPGPARAMRAQPGTAPGPARAMRAQPGIVAFASAEYVNGLVANAVAFVPPVLVAHVVGASASAYLTIPWLIGVAASTLLWNIVTSLVVSAAGARPRLDHAVRLGLVVIVPGTAVLIGGATPLLGILGPEYAANGAPALRLIGASLPFTGVVLLYAAFCVMDRRMWTLTAVQGIGAVILLAGTGLTLPALGPSAPALAYLISQAVLAVAVLPRVIGTYRTKRAHGIDASFRSLSGAWQGA